ncbi:hypothetical protein ACSSS7_007414 [Eimeria intestinalis]
MNWATLSSAVVTLALLLCSGHPASCAPATAPTSSLRSRAASSPEKLEDSTSSEKAKEEGSEKEGDEGSTDVGLLDKDSSEEQERALGVLERDRSSGDRQSDTSEVKQRSEGESSEEQQKETTPKNKCTPACRDDWRGDGWCDTVCNTEGCNFDDGDCTGWCAGDCKPSWLGDGNCDSACYNEACEWDKGDCKKWKEEGVTEYNRRALQQKQKQLKQHKLELPDCKCERRLLVNGSCTPECNTPECLFDGGECLDMCNAKCAKSWLGDGDCDRDCDTDECGHDKGDCDSSTNVNLQAVRAAANTNDVCDSACRLWMIGNSICDKQCNNKACGFDGGDCDNVSVVLEVDYSAKPEVYQFCAKEWIGDGSCDPNCFNKESKWDGGDCEGTDFEKEQAEKGIGPQFDK